MLVVITDHEGGTTTVENDDVCFEAPTAKVNAGLDACGFDTTSRGEVRLDWSEWCALCDAIDGEAA